MNKLSLVILVSMVLGKFTIYGQNMRIYPSIEGLTEFEIPTVYSTDWYNLNHSKDDYYTDHTGNVIISNISKSRESILEVQDGKLIGTNYGEWGGKLIFKNDKIEYTILQKNICGIINFGNEIYVLTGLSHLGIREGKIIKIEQINGKWKCTFNIDLNNSPEIFDVFENELYIVTFDGLAIFDGNNIQQLLKKQFWANLYPQSIYVNEKIIGIGLRGCIAIINKENNEVKYYKK